MEQHILSFFASIAENSVGCGSKMKYRKELFLLTSTHPILAMWGKSQEMYIYVLGCPKRYLAYLGTPNMVKWGVPEKILQNTVQMRFLGQ